MGIDGIKIIELLTIAMFFVGFYGLITSKNIIKSIIFVVLIETAVIMFFLGLGYQSGALLPPIGESFNNDTMAYVSDPLPQALMITAVVIGLSTTAINIVLFITLFRKYQTANWDIIKSIKNLE
ncbi:MAG: cation:proton antiporter subunit C [Defluviitaleaceae bacterium]|nr:cation:proton antiporter subunit C [Defluviitaleaceae bacterium]